MLRSNHSLDNILTLKYDEPKSTRTTRGCVIHNRGLHDFAVALEICREFILRRGWKDSANENLFCASWGRAQVIRGSHHLGPRNGNFDVNLTTLDREVATCTISNNRIDRGCGREGDETKTTRCACHAVAHDHCIFHFAVARKERDERRVGQIARQATNEDLL
jgi:hypothetical protein